MSRLRRASLLDVLVLPATALATGWLATTAWRGFTETPGRFLVPLLGLALLVLLLGAAARRLRLPALLTFLLQLVVGGLVATSLVAAAPVVTGSGWLGLGSELSAAVTTAQRYQAPVPADVPGIEPLLVLGGWLCFVAIDTIVGGLRRVPLVGLPLLVIYSIPVGMLGGGVPWWSFALTAAGFLLLLYLQHRDQTARWGRGLGDAEAAPRAASGSHAVRGAAATMGSVTLLLAVLVPQFVPTMSLDVLGFGAGGSGGGDITVDNPMTDLRRDFLSSEDRPLVQVTTENPDPRYLRIAVLNRFRDNEWSTGGREIPETQRAEGALPVDDDIDPALPRQQYDTDLTAMAGFDSRWLPTPYPSDRVFAQGDWRYDAETLDFLAADEDLNAGGNSYQASEMVIDYDAAQLSEAGSWAGQVSRDYIEVPDDFPTFVRSLAQEVTREYPTRYEKAVALQQWFREGGGFEYSTQGVDVGNGTDELVAFLTEGDGGRVGYCEQFASAMAAMARSLNIPARVAVGFLTPAQIGERTYEYSTDDLHAWPELYFEGAGWVLFEPTPSDRAAQVPGYTLDRVPSVDPTAQPSQTQATQDPAQNQGATRQPDPGALPEGDSAAGDGQGGAWRPVAGWAAGGVLVVLLLVAPRVVRRGRARARLTGAVEPAWEEVRATAVDLGLPWPDHRSPRDTGRVVGGWLGATDPAEALLRPPRGRETAPEAAEALDRLVQRQEQERYARPRGDEPVSTDPQVVRDVETVVASLRGGAGERAVRRATWWPASVLPWSTRATRRTDTTPPELVRHGGVVDHVG
jgi:transglutaminase-like putative cysteine protease